MKKVILSLLAGVCVMIAVSCSKENLNITGDWTSSLTLKNDLASPENEEKTVGYAYVKQQIDFTFAEDGNYHRTISQSVIKAEAADDTFDAAEYMKEFGNKSENVELFGTYKVKGDKLTITNHSLKNGDNLIPYEEFYQQVQALGPVVSTVKIALEDEKLSIDGISFSKK